LAPRLPPARLGRLLAIARKACFCTDGIMTRRIAQILGGTMGQRLFIVSESLRQQNLETRLLVFGRF
jgi:hypothetical protein